MSESACITAVLTTASRPHPVVDDDPVPKARSMELLAKESLRLQLNISSALGVVSTAIGAASLSLPGVVDPSRLLVVLPLCAVLLLAHVRPRGRFELGWVVIGVLAGIGVLWAAHAPLSAEAGAAPAVALLPIAAGALPAFAPVLLTSRPRTALLVLTAVASLALIATISSSATEVVAAAGVAWLGLTFASVWLRATVQRAAWRIQHAGRAHRLERQASEAEAQRRQGARLLHDTVLATLTMLAHSGVGVSSDALRQQAAEDARLLRQLRLGASPTPAASGQYELAPVGETVLGTTLESVKQRFRRMGLEVAWHGTGQVLLPSDVLDAFLMALAECLENVRRHSGVTQAHVTITTDDTTVRAMVTDSGVGFDLDGVDDHKLGFRESVVGRLREVGGSARLFSGVGQGTTVVLEVPR